MPDRANNDPWGSTVTPMPTTQDPVKYRRKIGSTQVDVIHYPEHKFWAVYVQMSIAYGAQWSAGGLKSREQAEALAEKAAPLVITLAEAMEAGDE